MVKMGYHTSSRRLPDYREKSISGSETHDKTIWADCLPETVSFFKVFMNTPDFTPGAGPQPQGISRRTDLKRIRRFLKYCCAKIEADNLTDVAGNISFTIILSLVPILAIMLAVFTRFPAFGTLRHTLEAYFAQGMIPGNIAQTILDYLGTFAANAANVSIIGALALLFTTLTTISTIEGAFNRIWHILTPRPLLTRIVLYIAIALLAPLLLGISIYLTTYLVLSRHGLIGWLPFLNGISSPLIAVIWTTIAFTLLYRVLPNRLVLWKDALSGGLFAAVAFEIAIRVFAFFIVNFSSYEKVYGALAAFPIFMLWVYISSLIMLLGAMFTASLPEIRSGLWESVRHPGSLFSDALKIIGIMYPDESENGLPRIELERRTRLGTVEVENCLKTLETLGWIAPIKRSMLHRVPLGKRTLRTWQWQGDADHITVADVFRHFVFTASRDTPISFEVEKSVANVLNMTLAEYFRHSGAIPTGNDDVQKRS